MAEAEPGAVEGVLARLTGPRGPFEIETDDQGAPLGFRAAPHSWPDLCRRARSMPDRPFVQEGGVVFSAHQTVRRAAAVSRTLAACGMQRGDRVGLAESNSYRWVVGFLGILLPGGVAVLLPQRPAQDVRLLLKRCEAKLVLGGQAPSAPDMAGDCRYIEIEDIEADEEPADPPPVDPGDDALIAFTSGSSGMPKGAMFTHRASVGALRTMTLGAAVAAVRKRSVSGPPTVQQGRVQRVLVAAPLSHISGYGQIGLALMLGHHLLLPDSEGPQAIVAQVEREEATAVAGASISTLRKLIDDAAPGRFSSLRSIGVHGAGVDEETRAALAAALPDVQMVTGYGLTETGGGVAVAIEEDGVERGCVGPVTPPVQAQVRGADGRSVEAGRSGRLWLRGPTLMRGYLGDPACLDAEGWFDTGDIARVDKAGLLYIMARGHGSADDDLVLRAQALAREVQRDPAIDEACAVPAVSYDPLAPADAIDLYVTAKPAADLSAVEALCREGGARLRLVSAMPRTPSGKVDLTALRVHSQACA